MHRFVKAGLVCLGILGFGAGAAAQETVGKRFFSDTLVISEPFVEDELSLPSVLHIRRPASDTEPRTLLTEIGGEVKKRLTPRLELSVAGALRHVDPDGTRIENLTLGLKYQYFASEAHEAVLSAALGWEVGGTGQRVAGAESLGVVNPALLFGKGLGDLPEDYAWLKPIAVSGCSAHWSLRVRARDVPHPRPVKRNCRPSGGTPTCCNGGWSWGVQRAVPLGTRAGRKSPSRGQSDLPAGRARPADRLRPRGAR